MPRILADSSAWIEYDRATGSPAHLRMRRLLDSAGRENLACTEPVLMEVLAGARTDQRSDDLRRLLTSTHWITCDAVGDYEAAATIYRRCRGVGVTPRGLLDCLIVAIARRAKADLLAYDADIARVAAVLDCPLDVASLRP